MNVGIVIPSYKNEEQLKRCKEAIKNTTYPYLIIQVEDNNKVNRGFTKACNCGIKTAWDRVDDYFIVLNQDCYLHKDSIKNMVDFMDKNPKCAIAGIKQISDTDEDLIIHGGCKEAFPTGVHISGKKSNGDCNVNKQMPWINGACMIVSKKAIREIGLMDEIFFLIGSDSDWCYTARQRGWEVWYIANAEAIHEGGASMKPPDKNVENIMKLDIVNWRDKWIVGGSFRELSLEVF